MKAALAADTLRLADDVTHDLRGRANIVYDRAGLTRVEAAVFGITFKPAKRGDNGVTDHLDRLSGAVDAPDDGTLSRTLSDGRRPASSHSETIPRSATSPG